ncbi:LysR family transcriptional regulator [Vibrio hangzhouensis]|uniref:DNA-binding transcriptional regulator, LysR family n=1 Tax=Vibrio hangzhouensis TaxID=462991 RepID=A0A1H6A8T0_9VIBR|nr:LysR family transcriptional regulator [Vibrio hangzhouensis]SEG44720.1 DNA-binding transcriptional regulator, LysR family [Vibrio hangzhouensis]
MIITTERLRYFVSVAEQGSFSAAARELGVSVSAVNQTIINLEEDLEVTLFERRSGKKPKLTVEGRSLYFKSLDVLPRILGIEQYAETLKLGVESAVTIAVHPYSFYNKYVELFKAFTDKYPQVQLNIVDSETLETFDEGFDLLIAPSSLEVMRARNVESVDRLEWKIVCSEEHPLAKLKGRIEVADLQNHTQLMMAEGFITKPEYREALRYSSSFINVTNFYQYRQLLLSGVGFATYPAELLNNNDGDRKLIILDFEFGSEGNSWPIDLVWSDNIGIAGQWLVGQLTG